MALDRDVIYCRFREIPPAWEPFAYWRCLFCKRGRGEVAGLWRLNHEHYICGGCQRELKFGRMPEVVR